MEQVNSSNPKPRRLKGQTWQVEEMMKVFLIIIVFGGVIIVIMAITGGLTSVINDFCEKNPEWCGSIDPDADEYAIVKKSTDALVCAINSVVGGKPWPGSGCSAFYGSPPEESAGNEQDDTRTYPNPSVSFSDDMTGMQTADDSDDNDAETVIDCEGNMCTVYNFQLPQKLKGPLEFEEWINGYGDPKYLVYWQAFPIGEDSDWKSWSAWYSGVGTIGFAVSCALGGIITLGSGVKAILKSPKTVTSGIANLKSSRAFKNVVVEGMDGDNIATGIVKTLDDLEAQKLVDMEVVGPRIVQYAQTKKTPLAKATKKYLLPALKTSLESKGILTKSHSTFNSLLMKAGVTTTVVSSMTAVGANIQADKDAYAEARLESEMGKFYPSDVPNSIILQKSLIERIPHSLIDNVIPKSSSITNPTEQNIIELKMPVVLDKSEETISTPFGNDITEFYLVSPCFANLEITKEEKMCGIYGYNKATGQVQCTSPKEGSEFWDERIMERKPCGSLLKVGGETPDRIITNEYEFINNLGNIQVFSTNVNVDIPTEGFLSDEELQSIGCERAYLETVEATWELVDFTQTGVNIADFESCEDAGPNQYMCYVCDEGYYGTEENGIHLCGKPAIRCVRDIIYDPINKITFYFNRDPENMGIDYFKNEDNEYFPVSTEETECATRESDFVLLQDSPIDKDIEEKSELYSEDEDIFECKFSFDDKRKFYFYAKMEGEPEELVPSNFFGLRLGPSKRWGVKSSFLPREIVIVIKDNPYEEVYDGYADHLANYYFMDNTRIMQQRAFDDTDRDGSLDSVSGDSCLITAITITPTKVETDDEDNNYCFKKDYTGYIDFAATTGAIGISSLSKVVKVGGFVGWGLSTATDCALAYATSKIDTRWPDNRVRFVD